MKSNLLWPAAFLVCLAGITMAVSAILQTTLPSIIIVLCALVVCSGAVWISWHYTASQKWLAQTIRELPGFSRQSTSKSPDATVDDDLESLLSRLRREQQITFKNLVHIAEKTDASAMATAEVSAFVDDMRQSIIAQSKRAKLISGSAQDMAETTAAIAGNSQIASAAATKTLESSNQGLANVSTLENQFLHINAQVDCVSETLQALQSLSESIEGITGVIHGVAEQTNLLALNASIEAARAGEHGRGFSVVADEVRGLATKTSESTTEIEKVLKKNMDEASNAVKIMQMLQPQMEDTRTTLGALGQSLTLIQELATQSEKEVSAMNASMSDHVRASTEVSESVLEISRSLQASEQQSMTAANDALKLSELAESLAADVSIYDLDTRNDRVRKIAQQGAEQVTQCFEKALREKLVTESDLFDRHYQQIEGTNPPKYHTRYDSFTDSVLPGIQEPLLQLDTNISYAGAVDDHGYFPTHNKAFSKPLTGDYDTDLANNRTKRLFTDRTGLRCAQNTQPFLLQTYKRDTGEIFHDVSVPIFIRGRHWGGFRVGYRADQ